MLSLVLYSIIAFFISFFPGFLPQVCGGLSLSKCLVFAPHVSIALYCGVAILLSLAGIPCSAISLLIVCLVISCILSAVITLIRKKRDESLALARGTKRDASLALFLLTGVIVSGIVYYSSIFNISAPVQSYDNLFHYNVIEGLLNSSDWSTLHVSVYPGGVAPTTSPAGFYPIAWHTLAAILSSIAGISVVEASHVVNFVFMSVVFSAGSFYFLREIFHDRSLSLGVSAIVFCFNAAFPWVLFCVWPLFPNASSLCLTPAVMGAFIKIVHELLETRRLSTTSFGAWAPLVVGAISLAFTQPNALFSCAAILAPYCVYAAYIAAKDGKLVKRKKSFKPVFAPMLCVVIIFLLWVLVANLPMLRGVVQYYWPPISTIWQACVDFALAAYPIQAVQLIPAILTLVGLVYSLLHPKYAWISAALFFNGLIFVVSASFGDNLVKHLLSGFWYTDPYRTASNLALVAMPLICLGATWIVKSIYSRAKAISSIGSAYACCGLFLLVIGVLNYTSYYEIRGILEIHTPYEGITASCHDLTNLSSEDDVVLTQEEASFLDEVASVVGDSDLIANCPFDGSAFSYALDGLNVYSRRYEGFDSESETDLSVDIRSSLDDLASSEELSSQMRGAGFKYVLILGRDYEHMSEFSELFHEEDWEGFYSVNDSTPGFEVVLSEGDMRLYEIVYPE